MARILLRKAAMAMATAWLFPFFLAHTGRLWSHCA
jgi:hypothetical protein